MRHHSSHHSHSSFGMSHHHHHYSAEDVQNSPLVKNQGVKKGMRIIGGILLAVGIVLIIIGLVLFIGFGIFAGPPTSEGSLMKGFGTAALGMIASFAGFVMVGIGAMLLYLSFLGTVAKFYADETQPAVRTMGEGAGEGVATGIRKGGGIGERSGRKRKDVVKVKCRGCGYLDTEDATYCSKCGEKL